MPITNTASYIPTINEFIAHWSQVDALLTAPLIIVAPDQSAVNLENFTDLRHTLQQQFQQITTCLNDVEIARGGIRIDKVRMLSHLNEFTSMLDGYWGATPFSKARPHAPSISDGEHVFLTPMRDALSLWEKINTSSAPVGIILPLQLSDRLTAEAFAAEIANLQAAYVREARAKQDTVLARSQRNITMATANSLMVTYRKIIPARCAQHPALVTTLPTLTPPPGHTPEPVTATAVFAEPSTAKVAYTASKEATIVRIELRGHAGDTYHEEDATVLATHTPTDPREFAIPFDLTQPGSRLALKVYVVLATGNEAGTPAMILERPA